jgi:hypothetical protein
VSDLRDNTVSRRLVSVGGTFAVAVVLLPLSVVIVPALFLVDLAMAPRRLPLSRGYLFGLFYLLWECVAAVSTAGLWVLSGFGLLMNRRWMQNLHVGLQRIWADAQMSALRRLLRLSFDFTAVESIPTGPLICFARHASMIDTLIPMRLFTDAQRRCRYVLKSELMWDPALDIVGHRLPNHFVDRSGGQTPVEVAALRTLAEGLDDDEVYVLFPEGSRFTEAKQERALTKLSQAESPQFETAKRLRRTMPPRSSGVNASLDGAPHAGVMILVHTGLEGLSSFRSILRLIPFAHPIKVGGWVVPRSGVPSDPNDRTSWLFEQWLRVDQWVLDNQSAN